MQGAAVLCIGWAGMYLKPHQVPLVPRAPMHPCAHVSMQQSLATHRVSLGTHALSRRINQVRKILAG